MFLQLQEPTVQEPESRTRITKPSAKEPRTHNNKPEETRTGKQESTLKPNEGDASHAYDYGYDYRYDYGYYYSYSENGVNEIVVEIASCTFLLYSDETSYDFCVKDGQCDYCNGDTEFTVRWDNAEDLRYRALWVLYDFPNPEDRAVGNELYGASALDDKRRRWTLALDSGPP